MLYSKTPDLVKGPGGLLNGRSRVIRTLDPLLPKQVRYQAALYSDKAAATSGGAEVAGL
jgi:hypothetical protein